ncbi:MAG: DNA-binding response regulator [Tardiphaga sp.]|nr:DNA-binding response regulator [Tardiphaga sp.]
MRLLVVDDHQIMRDGLAALLKHVSPDTTVLQARDANEALTLIDRHGDLDAIILDLRMPGMDGFQAISVFGRKRPDLPVIVLSSSEDPQDARRAMACGALGYVPKSASQHELLSAIRQVLNGELYVPAFVADNAAATAGADGRSDGRADRSLTPRQIEILALMSQGTPNKIIAARLHLSEKTIKAHITAIFKALNVNNRTQASVVARQAGLI